MSLGTMLDVTIGLMFVFLLLSLIATAAQEAIASFLQKRGTELQKALRALLVGEKTDEDLAREAAALISQGTSLFADPGANLFKVVQGHALVSNGTPARVPSYIAAENFSTALVSVLTRGKAAPAVVDIVEGAKALPEGPVRDAVVALAQKAGTDIDKMRAEIGSWFDGAMDRVSGTYKRWAQRMTLLFGLGVAIVLNVNTIDVALTLWANPKNTAEIAQMVQKQLPALEAAATNKDADQRELVAQSLSLLDRMMLPIGWNATKDTPVAPACTWLAIVTYDKASAPPVLMQICTTVFGYGVSGFFHAILGWLVTGLAVSLGAPFWFDMLKNVINLRGAGPKPATAVDAARGKPA